MKNQPEPSTQSISRSNSSTPQTMEELLASSNTKLSTLKRGDKVTAHIISVSKREVVADIGAKSYGIITGREFEHIQPTLSLIKVGDTLPAEVIIPEMESGETLISLRRTLSEKLWGDLKRAKETGSELSVTALKAVSGGVLVDCQGLRGFVPQQQLDPSHQEHPDRLVGTKFHVKILEVDQLQNRLIVSEREVTQADELAKNRKALLSFEKGETVSAEIVTVEKYALVVTVTKRKQTVPGVVHISEVSWERIEHLSDSFKPGDSIKAEIIDIDTQEVVLVLSVKRLTPDPWQDIEKKYPKDAQITGTVVKVTGLGVFVELEKGIEGLIHISKLPAEKEFKEGDKIPVLVDKLDQDNRKISLTYVSITKPIGYR